MIGLSFSLFCTWFLVLVENSGSTAYYYWAKTTAPTKAWTSVAANNQGNYILAAATYVNSSFPGGLYISLDAGSTWTLSSANTTQTQYWTAACLGNSGEYMVAGASNLGIYISQNRGGSWTLTYSNSGGQIPGVACNINGQVLYAITNTAQVLQSTNYGSSWTTVYSFNKIGYSISCDYNGYRVVVGLQDGVYYSSDGGLTWTQEWITADGTIPAVGSSTYGIYFVAAQYTIQGANPVGGVLSSSSNGSSWSYRLNTADVLSAVVGGNGQYMSYMTNSTVYVSDSYGSSFTASFSKNKAQFKALAIAQGVQSLFLVEQMGGLYMGQIVNTMTPSIVPSLAPLPISATPTVISNKPTASPTRNSGGGGGDGGGVGSDDQIVLLSFTGISELIALLLALLPVVLLAGAGATVRYLRWNGFPSETSPLRPPLYEAVDISIKCCTWFFFVLNLASAPMGNAGSMILIIGRVPHLFMWGVIVYLIFSPYPLPFFLSCLDPQPLPPDPNSDPSHSSPPLVVSLKHYLHAPSLKQRSIGTTRNSNFYTVILMISILDLSLVTYLPWKRTDFTTMSRAYPTLTLLRGCLYGGLVSCALQAVGSVVLFVLYPQDVVSRVVYIVLSVAGLVRVGMDVCTMLLVFSLLLKKETELIRAGTLQSRGEGEEEMGMRSKRDESRGDVELREEEKDIEKNMLEKDTTRDATEEEEEEVEAGGVLSETTLSPFYSPEMPLYPSKFKHVDETNLILRSQLTRLGVTPLEYLPLEDIRKELSILLAVLNKGGEEVEEGRLDYLLQCMELHPQYQQERAEERRRWVESIQPFLRSSLSTMRALVPPDIFSLSERELVERHYYSLTLAKRIITKKCLWLVRLHPAEIEKLHEVELRGRFSPEAQHLDIVELGAVFASLPETFSRDPYEKKKAWRERIEQKLKDMLEKKDKGGLSAQEKRHGVYKGQDGKFGHAEELFRMHTVPKREKSKERDEGEEEEDDDDDGCFSPLHGNEEDDGPSAPRSLQEIQALKEAHSNTTVSSQALQNVNLRKQGHTSK